jgi:DNA-binding response OmpR family regulator
MLILLVEDYPDCAASTAMLLDIWGHEAVSVRDGKAAVMLAQKRPPDVVLLDIGLPSGMDGWTVARQLRDQTAGRRMLLIAVTGFGKDDDRRHSDEAGIDIYLTKPVDPEQLRHILDRWQAHRA